MVPAITEKLGMISCSGIRTPYGVQQGNNNLIFLVLMYDSPTKAPNSLVMA